MQPMECHKGCSGRWHRVIEVSDANVYRESPGIEIIEGRAANPLGGGLPRPRLLPATLEVEVLGT
jgi:hypothetical protein